MSIKHNPNLSYSRILWFLLSRVNMGLGSTLLLSRETTFSELISKSDVGEFHEDGVQNIMTHDSRLMIHEY